MISVRTAPKRSSSTRAIGSLTANKEWFKPWRTVSGEGLADSLAPELQVLIEGLFAPERFLDLGCLISFAGPVTFKKADELREAARIVPLDRLLVETDCPFLAPHPYRGTRNEPAFAVLNAAAVAEARGADPAEVAAAALANARRLFGREHVR